MNRNTVSELLQHFSLSSLDTAAAADALESYCPSDSSLLGRVHTSGVAGYNLSLIHI